MKRGNKALLRALQHLEKSYLQLNRAIRYIAESIDEKEHTNKPRRKKRTRKKRK
jgi:hypothetical protein